MLSLFLAVSMVMSMLVVPAMAATFHKIEVLPGNYTVNLSSNTVEDGGSFSFTVKVDEAYDQSDYSVYSNAMEIEPDSNGRYVVDNVTTDQTIQLYNLEKNTYTVTFMMPDGSMVRKTGVEHGTQLVPEEYPDVAAKEGYTVRWDKTNVTVTDNMTITGTYVPTSSSTYTITYDLNGGKWADSTSVPTQYDGTATVTLPNPVRDGYEFLGWVGTNLTSATKNVVIGVGSTGNRTYTAVWSNSTSTYTVTFDMNGHGTQIAPITGVSYGSAISAPTAPTAAGWTFSGWYQDKDLKTAWNFGTNLVTKNITLYAKWVDKDGNVAGDDNKDDGKDDYTETDSYLDGYERVEETTEVTVDGKVTTTVVTEERTNIRTGKTTTKETTTIEDEENGIISIIVIEEDENGDETAYCDSYIYGFYEEDEDEDEDTATLTIDNDTGEDIKTLYMATSRNDLNEDDSDNLLEKTLDDRKSVKLKDIDLGRDDRWYFRALDADGDVIITDYVTFEDAAETKSATVVLGEDGIELESERFFSGSRGDDMVFEFDSDRIDAMIDQMDEVYSITKRADRDGEVNVTFYATVEDAVSTELLLDTELVDALEDCTDGYVYVETLDGTLKFPTATWSNIAREVSRELSIMTESDGSNTVSVTLKDNRSELNDFGTYTIKFPYDGTINTNIVGYIVNSKNDKNGTLVQKSYVTNECVVIPVSSSCTVTARSNAKEFVDNTSVWSVDAIRFVTAREIFYGTAPNVYSPNTGMTRAMIVQILYRLEGAPEVAAGQEFVDVPADFWAHDAVNWARANGIVDGVGNGYFEPSALITREQLTKILFSYGNYLGLDTSARADISGFTDIYDSPDWAKDAMSYAVAVGLIYGNGQNTLNPKGVVTRAQMAVVMQRMIEGIN